MELIGSVSASFAIAPFALVQWIDGPRRRTEPTVILISLDGVRADYLSKGLTPHLLNISRKGLRSDFLQPVFPSLTFVNHWSILCVLRDF